MEYSLKDILSFIEANDVKFVRLAFCDIFGAQKNISVIANRFSQLLEDKVTFDPEQVKGFGDSETGDLCLTPDWQTLSVLPWRPQQGRVIRLLCDVDRQPGLHHECDTRRLLIAATERAAALGYKMKLGVECEFYLFKAGDDGTPTQQTQDQGGYFDMSPLDNGENIRREICLSLDEMGLMPETSHHESGPGQNEIDFKCDEPLRAADDFLTFKSVVKAIASLNGLFASFMPYPLQGRPGNGLRVNFSLYRGGENVFSDFGSARKEEAESFTAGVLAKLPEISAFLNPIANSYERLSAFTSRESVSLGSRSALLRIPQIQGDKARLEFKTPDSAVNPYLAFALIINAGLDGVESGAKLGDISTSPLPATLSEALSAAEASAFVSAILGKTLLERYISMKRPEAAEYDAASDRHGYSVSKYFRKL